MTNRIDKLTSISIAFNIHVIVLGWRYFALTFRYFALVFYSTLALVYFRPVQRPVQQPTQQLVEPPVVQQPARQPVQRPVQQPAQQLVQPPVLQQPVRQPVQRPVQHLISQSSKQLTQQNPTRQLPTLDEFLVDISNREPLLSMPKHRDPNERANYLAQTGQEDDSIELVNAREMALATTGLFADCTPTMAYYIATGNQIALIRERNRVRASEEASQSELSAHRAPKRAAAQKASTVWAELGPRKRQRRL